MVPTNIDVVFLRFIFSSCSEDIDQTKTVRYKWHIIVLQHIVFEAGNTLCDNTLCVKKLKPLNTQLCM